MPVTFTKGNLFAYPGLAAIAHGCNCRGVMGKGIAVEFASRYPKMYAEYRDLCARGQFKLGTVFLWTTATGQVVFNLGTQRAPGVKAEMSAIETALKRMIRLAEEQHLPTVGLPRIGAGLGGLPWAPIRSLMGDLGQRAKKVELVVLEAWEPEPAIG